MYRQILYKTCDANNYKHGDGNIGEMPRSSNLYEVDTNTISALGRHCCI